MWNLQREFSLSQLLTHLVQLGLVAWEGEGEAKGEFLVFDLQLV